MAAASSSEQSTTAQSPTLASGSRHTRWFLAAYYALALVWGIRSIRFWDPSALDLLVPVAFAITLGWWAVVDARRRQHPIPMLARPWFFVLAGLLAPGYVVWSRKWRGVGWVALNLALWYAVATAVMNVGGVLVFGDRWLNMIHV